MPWSQTDVTKERVKFVLEWERRWKETHGGRVDLAELCRMFGISRPTGYLWVARFREAGHDVRAMQERSRRPLSNPRAVSLAIEEAVVAARRERPRWGARKLRTWLVDRHPGRVWPSASCIASILKRRGLAVPRRRRRHVVPLTQPFAACDRPNAVWCVDFKGWFRTANGDKCQPLTVIDAYSRLLLRCEAVEAADGQHVRSVFDSAFREYGLPLAIRSDNGPPFASTGAGGLTALNVWWLRLGIRLERITPGKPQQNGRQERFHLTLKLDVPTEKDLRSQQRAFDLYRVDYNEERPHEALGQKAPATAYQRSRRSYPRPLERIEAAPWCHSAAVDQNGAIRWRNRRIHISHALALESVALAPSGRGRWEVSYGPIDLGTIDDDRLERGLILHRRRSRRGPIERISLDREV
jgi:transposase InsO family protein